ncbi:hypothetical protein JHK86_048274 [Glycine max]|nr:hypothetical protein JHK86_048274 [Glycine max]
MEDELGDALPLFPGEEKITKLLTLLLRKMQVEMVEYSKRRHELHKRQLDNVVAVTEARPSLRQTRTQEEGETHPGSTLSETLSFPTFLRPAKGVSYVNTRQLELTCQHLFQRNLFEICTPSQCQFLKLPMRPEATKIILWNTDGWKKLKDKQLQIQGNQVPKFQSSISLKQHSHLMVTLWGGVYPISVAAHPQKPVQFAVGLLDGSVYVFEPRMPGGDWIKNH